MSNYNFLKNAAALWDRDDPKAPGYLKRTPVQYFRGNYVEVLESRGLANRLLDSFIQALPNGTIIAGGFVAAVVGDSKDAKDIDLFFTSSEAFAAAVSLFIDPDKYLANDAVADESECWAVKGYKPDPSTMECVLDAAQNPNSRSELLARAHYLKFVHPTRPPVQLIKMTWFKDAEHVIDSFDLTVVQFAIDVQTQDLVANPVSFLDVARRRLVLHRMQFPSSTLRRVIKYSKKGYFASPAALANISRQVAEHIDTDEQYSAAKTKEFYGDEA